MLGNNGQYLSRKKVEFNISWSMATKIDVCGCIICCKTFGELYNVEIETVGHLGPKGFSIVTCVSLLVNGCMNSLHGT